MLPGVRWLYKCACNWSIKILNSKHYKSQGSGPRLVLIKSDMKVCDYVIQQGAEKKNEKEKRCAYLL